MTIEEFYNVIRRDSDPGDFLTIQQDIAGVFYSKSQEISLDNGTAYYLNVFKKHGDKKFFWSWNWAAFFAPTTFSFYRKIYFFWFLKWACIITIFALQEISMDVAGVLFAVYMPAQRIYFAMAANSMCVQKVKQRFSENKDARMQPSTAGGVCGLLLIPGLF
jgi:hypothetical protein